MVIRKFFLLSFLFLGAVAAEGSLHSLKEIKLCSQSLDLGSARPAAYSESNKLAPARLQLIDAYKKNYREWGHSEILIKLLKLGVSHQEIDQLARPVLLSSLEQLENVGNRPGVSKVTPKFSEQERVSDQEGQNSARVLKNFEEFSEVYNLENARAYVSEILSFPVAFAGGRGVGVDHVLRGAMLVGDSELIDRAREQAFRFGKQRSLIGIATHFKEQTTLMDLAEFNLVRFLYFHRNTNWLSDALAAFVGIESEGPYKLRAQSMLYDFFDIVVKSPMSASEIDITVEQLPYYSSIPSDPYNSLLKVLMATLDMEARHRCTSSTCFNYTMEATSSRDFSERLELLLNKYLADQGYNYVAAGEVASALALTGNAELQLEMAEKFYQSSMQTPEHMDSTAQGLYAEYRLRVALALYMVAGRKEYLVKFLANLKKVPALQEGTNPFAIYGSALNYFSPALMNYIKSLRGTLFVENERINTSLQEDLNKFIKRYDDAVTEKEDAFTAPSLFYEQDFHHEFAQTSYVLEESTKISADEVGKVRSQAVQKLEDRQYFQAYQSFGKIGDLDGLTKTYKAMMDDGRGVDAVEAAFMILVIKNINSGEDLKELFPGSLSK